MSGILWDYEEELREFLIQISTNHTTAEDKFIRTLNNLCMYQINNTTNSQNKFLDLVFTSDYQNTSMFAAHELLDNNSLYHSAIHIEIDIEYTDNANEIVTKNFINVNLKQSKNISFNLITEDDVNEFHYHNSPIMAHKIKNITDMLYNIQFDCTSNRKTQTLENISKQPWTLNNKKYISLYHIKITAKKNYNNDPTIVNKDRLKTGHVELYLLYNSLKTKYYDDLISNVH